MLCSSPYVYIKRDFDLKCLCDQFLKCYQNVFSADAVNEHITPDQTILTSAEGTNITLSCTYDDSLADYLYWYQQKPRSGPKFLLMIYKSTEHVIKAEQPHPELSIKLRKKEKKVILEFSSASVSDSSLYYCAMKPTVTGNPTTQNKNLIKLFCFFVSGGGAV